MGNRIWQLPDQMSRGQLLNSFKGKGAEEDFFAAVLQLGFREVLVTDPAVPNTVRRAEATEDQQRKIDFIFTVKIRNGNVIIVPLQITISLNPYKSPRLQEKLVKANQGRVALLWPLGAGRYFTQDGFIETVGLAANGDEAALSLLRGKLFAVFRDFLNARHRRRKRGA